MVPAALFIVPHHLVLCRIIASSVLQLDHFLTSELERSSLGAALRRLHLVFHAYASCVSLLVPIPDIEGVGLKALVRSPGLQHA